MNTLTEQQAYAAMFRFLEEHWERSPDLEVALLLSDMSLLADGSPADQAVVADWARAVDYAVKGGTAGALILKK